MHRDASGVQSCWIRVRPVTADGSSRGPACCGLAEPLLTRASPDRQLFAPQRELTDDSRPLFLLLFWGEVVLLPATLLRSGKSQARSSKVER